MAADAWRALLILCPRERAPLAWAATQKNLGNALCVLGDRGDDEALRRAVATFEDVLVECTRELAPLAWAMTQNNLGLVLWRLGERESGTARLEEAVAAFRAALEEYRRDRVPLQWAMTTGNQGVALMLLAERLGDESRERSAVQQIEMALVVIRDAGSSSPPWSTKRYRRRSELFSIVCSADLLVCVSCFTCRSQDFASSGRH